MFGLFKKKSPIEKLTAKREKLLQEAFDLSKSNRSASDKKMKEAEDIAQEIEALEKVNS